jgi:signal-induced proliferation-associated 1 like protein 1
MGQLGFHVQPDGVVTQVESLGLAWQAGLRHGARLVEICKVAVSTLSHDQMVDLLKTSMMVTVTVIPPLPDGSPRRGCTLQNCRYTLNNYEGDYENVSGGGGDEKLGRNAAAAVPGKHRRLYERSFSPPRSSNSSGYGTGSSSKSFADPRFPANSEGTMTSSSSGHSSDDRWYELLEQPDPDMSVMVHESPPPPPLPARLGSGGSSAFQQVPPKQSQHGSKVPLQATHSLPLSASANYSLPPTAPPRYNTGGEYESPTHHDFKLGEKVTCLKTSMGEARPLPLPRPALDYLTTRTPKISDYSGHPHAGGEMVKSSSLPPDCVTLRGLAVGDGHSTDTSSTSERLFGAPSEDELSAGSSNVSPRLRRSTKHIQSNGIAGGGSLTPTSGSSRNQSPRLRDTGEARLRPGVTPRNSSNRNSANLTGSTLQEDLMRLINPDYMAERDEKANKEPVGNNAVAGKVHSSSNNSSAGGNVNDVAVTNRSRSRENLCNVNGNCPSLSVLPTSPSSDSDQPTREQRGREQLLRTRDQHTNSSNCGITTERASSGEVILTLARPATVISNASTASSPAPSENKLTKEERLSPRVTKSSGAKLAEPLPLPDAREMDWPSLVDTATRAMMQVQRDEPVPEAARNGESLGHWVDDVTERLGLDTTAASIESNSITAVGGRQMTELQSHLAHLEARVARETRRRLSLEEEVRRLRDENRRLQEESQTAAQQLRRFTEWFFQTIDRQ